MQHRHHHTQTTDTSSLFSQIKSMILLQQDSIIEINRKMSFCVNVSYLDSTVCVYECVCLYLCDHSVETHFTEPRVLVLPCRGTTVSAWRQYLASFFRSLRVSLLKQQSISYRSYSQERTIEKLNYELKPQEMFCFCCRSESLY